MAESGRVPGEQLEDQSRRVPREEEAQQCDPMPLRARADRRGEVGSVSRGRSRRRDRAGSNDRNINEGKEPTPLHQPHPRHSRDFSLSTPGTISDRQLLSSSQCLASEEPCGPQSTNTTSSNFEHYIHMSGISTAHSIMALSTKEPAKALPPHLRRRNGTADGKDVPPHLRGRKVSPELKEKYAGGNDKAKSAARSAVLAGMKRKSLQMRTPADSAPTTTFILNTSAGASPNKKSPEKSPPPAQSTVNGDDIEAKLESLGTKVTESKPVSKAALVAYTSSECTDRPVTPKSSTRVHQNANGNAKSAGPPASAKANSSVPPKGQPRPGTRGKYDSRGKGDGNQTPQESKFARTISRGDPDRWETKWFSEDEEPAMSIDSCWADSGYGGDGKKKRGIDPETGHQLADFNGGWAPAPVDWDARPGFAEQDAEKIEKWMAAVKNSMKGEDPTIPQDKLAAPDGTTYHFAPDPQDCALLVQGELAPRYWKPVAIGSESPNMFWGNMLKSKESTPVDSDDLKDVQPWWYRYVAESCFLLPRDHPSIDGVDPDEKEHERLARQNDKGSLHHAENRKQLERAKRDAQRQRRIRAAEKARKYSEGIPAGHPIEKIKPGVSLYLRSARPDDIQRLTEIYNHYVECSVSVPEEERQTEEQLLARYHDVLKKKLPFLVACERGGKVASRKRKGEDIILPDKVVGFAYADDHCNMKAM